MYVFAIYLFFTLQIVRHWGTVHKPSIFQSPFWEQDSLGAKNKEWVLFFNDFAKF